MITTICYGHEDKWESREKSVQDFGTSKDLERY